MSERLWGVLGDLTSFMLGGLTVGIGICLWLRDSQNAAGMAVVWFMLIGARGGIWVRAELEQP